MNRHLAIVVLVFCLLMLASSASASVSSDSLRLQVYPDGYAIVTQRLSTSSNSSSLEVQLLSNVVSNLVATDQNGSPLSYSISGGTNLTIYTLGATGATLQYDTNSLTSKNGTVWTLQFVVDYNATVVLPQYSTVTYVSGTPHSINLTASSPEVVVMPGSWKISYGVSISGVLSTTTSIGGPPITGEGSIPFLEIGAVVLAIGGAVSVGVLLWRRRGRAGSGGDLRPDDVQVLNFIQEKGGKVLEPEIRMKFALPKTSAWRQIKRLERMGYVKVTKIGSQNQIELTKNRNTGT